MTLTCLRGVLQPLEAWGHQGAVVQTCVDRARGQCGAAQLCSRAVAGSVFGVSWARGTAGSASGAAPGLHKLRRPRRPFLWSPQRDLSELSPAGAGDTVGMRPRPQAHARVEGW